MLIILFAFWLLLNGRWTTEIAIVGAVISGLIYLLCWKFFGYSPKREWRFFCRMPAFLHYFVWLIGEVFRSAFQTIHFIWSPNEIIVPKLTSFRTKMKTETGRVLLANSITMTPGTITVALQGDKLLVHCLDETYAEGLSGSEMERRLCRAEGGESHV